MESLTVGDVNEVTFNPVLSKEATQRRAHISTMEKYVFELVNFTSTHEYQIKDTYWKREIEKEIKKVQKFVAKQKEKYNP